MKDTPTSDQSQPQPAPKAPDAGAQLRQLGTFTVRLVDKGQTPFNTLRVGPRWSFSK